MLISSNICKLKGIKPQSSFTLIASWLFLLIYTLAIDHTIADELTHHAIQVWVLFFSLLVNIICQLSEREERQITHLINAGICKAWCYYKLEWWEHTDFSLDTLFARFSAIRLFSASSISSTAPCPKKSVVEEVLYLINSKN